MRRSSQTAGSGSEMAVLFSGGLDSAILLGEMAQRGTSVYPLYVRCGLRWEQAELAQVKRYLAAVAAPGLQPLAILEMPVVDLYGDHWSLGGPDIPDGDSSDEAVFLPGRNVLLLGKAMLRTMQQMRRASAGVCIRQRRRSHRLRSHVDVAPGTKP